MMLTKNTFHRIIIPDASICVSNTVLCKSNASDFRRNSWLFVAFRSNFVRHDISLIFRRNFVTPIVSIRVIFRTIIRSSRKSVAYLRTIIRSSRKCVVIFRAVIRSSRKFVSNFEVSICSLLHLRFR